MFDYNKNNLYKRKKINKLIKKNIKILKLQMFELYN